MKKTKIVLTSLCVILFATCFTIYANNKLFLHAENSHDFDLNGISYADQTGLFLQMDENGNVSYVDANPNKHFDDVTLPEEKDKDVTFDVSVVDYEGKQDEVGSYDSIEEAKKFEEKLQSYGGAAMTLDSSDKVALKPGETRIDIKTKNVLRSTTAPAIVVFKSEEDSNGYVKNINYNEVGTNIAGYVNPLYFYDAAYLGTENGKVKFKLAGVTGLVDEKKVKIIPYNSDMVISGYRVNDGKFYHYITTPYSISQHENNPNHNGYASVQRVGNAPKELKENVMYYSYDGHYFYSSFKAMISDYKNNTYSHAVNKNSPYYNYYQYLSMRSSSSFSKDDFNQAVVEHANSKSKLKNAGAYFVNAEKYGVNASLSFGLAVNESAWGMSNIAQSKNNIFGLNAIDSNPGEAANSFSSVESCINDFAKNWMSLGYLDPLDWRYYGPHFGDKQSGMNIKYASDPYWGEKAAAQSYILQDKTNKEDLNKYTVVVDQGNEMQYAYKEANTSSKKIYGIGDANNRVIQQFPYIVLNEQQSWYKIQSDAALSSDRNQIDQKSGLYDYDHNYVHVKIPKNKVVISTGKGNIPEEPSKPDENIMVGDVNGNRKIDAADYLMIMDTILGNYEMDAKQKKAGDVNQNGKIDAADYLMIMDCILGKIKL